MNQTILQPDYTQKRGGYQLAIPANVEIIIPSDDSVRLLSQVTEGLNYQRLAQAYSYRGRTKASPKHLFKIIVYGYMNGLYSSRQLEKACRRDINFMYLLEGRQGPDHATIARFKSHKAVGLAIEDLFYQMVEGLKELEEISGKNIYVDGTKLEANASRYSFVWRKAMEKQAARLQETMKAYWPEIRQRQGLAQRELKTIQAKDLSALMDELASVQARKEIMFVQGKGKRKSQLQRDYETVTQWQERQRRYEDSSQVFQGRNSFSKTDRDATFMRMKDDHMRNGQLKPGYNIQIAVDSEYIVGLDVNQEANDANALIPLLKRMEGQLSFAFESLTADAGYESEEAYSYLERQGIDAYIKPQTYERGKTRAYQKNIGLWENMAYNQREDYFLCDQGRQIVAVGKRKSRTKTGYEVESVIYQCEGCEDCPVKTQCIQSKSTRDLECRHKRLTIARNFQRLRRASLARIQSPLGILYRVNRSIQVEGAFGVLKEDMDFRRFLSRGKRNVTVEFLFLAFGFNLMKLHHKIQNHRLRRYLHFPNKAA